jgi:hypothetical protein
MMNFLKKHWKGEYSLPHSYWLHGSLLGLLIGMGAAFLAAATADSKGTSYLVPLEITCLVYFLLILVYSVWATGGIWRSATHRGGFWARAAKVMLVLGWLSGQHATRHLIRSTSPSIGQPFYSSCALDSGTASRFGSGLDVKDP